MKLKVLLLSMTSLLSASAFSATYYVSPNGTGSKDGSSPDNAFGVTELREQAAQNENGDIYYFEGGLYDLSEGTVVFKTATGATLIGNAEGERTVFSGDKNGNNNPDEGDANRLIRFQANTVNGNSANAIVVENIDFTCVYTQADADADNMSAFAVDNSGDVLVRNCRFYNNWAQGTRGGAAAYLYRSTVKFVDCMFYNNSANYRGGAIRIFSNSADKALTTLENCVVKNNRNYHNLGGAIFMGHGNSLNIINSTITGNMSVSDGAAIYHNGYSSSHHCELRIVNSTIAGNIATQADDAQIVTTQSAHVNIANSIITSDDDVAALLFKGTEANEAFDLVSGGWNYVGRIIDAVEKEIEWQESDEHGTQCTYGSIFGDNKLSENNVIVPAVFYPGATGAEVSEAVAAWSLPAGLDLTVDQLGNPRAGEVTPGAYALEKGNISSGVAMIGNGADTPRLVKTGEGRYKIEGISAVMRIYNVSGMLVARVDSDNIDLSTFREGIYVVKGANGVFKIMR